MKNVWKFVIAVLIVLVVVVLIVVSSKKEEKYFKKIQLDNTTNIVLNNVDKPYMDTILYVGLSTLNLSDIVVSILPLSENAKLRFASEGGELKAHIREQDGVYYIFIDDVDRMESIEILSHELIHLKQYYDKRLYLNENKTPVWLGQEYDINSTSYENRPWETEAFLLDDELNDKIKKVLF